jgi:hypothetical protein
LFTPVEFRSIASIGVAASNDDVTPVITSVRISVSDGEVTTVATDRYRIARSIFRPSMTDAIDPASENNILISAKELTKFWNSIKVAALKSHMPIILNILTDEQYPDNKKYVLEYDGSRVESNAMRGNYPPVEGLMTGYDESDLSGVPQVALKPKFLADLDKLFSAFDSARPSKDIAWTFRFKGTDSGKPGPVYITRKGESTDSGTLDYLVQPNLILR